MTFPVEVSEAPRDGVADPSPAPRPHRHAHPMVWLVEVFLLAWAALTAACVGLGLVLTHASLTAGIRRWDVSVNQWFVHRRTGTLDSVTAVGSHLAETPTVIGLGLVVLALVWWRRHDLYAVGFLVVGLALEVSVFVTTTLLVDRPRPPVHHLDAAPPTSSFPSGHTAAAIVLYVGIAILIRRVSRRAGVTTTACILLALVPPGVGLSRLYRGMHHPTDVFAGAALGIAALVIAGTVVRRAMLRAGRSETLANGREGHA